ncbi:hypothetical protein NX02_20510 [Sphingomonas sanxanigenens DSM 19645 = NX02]|uniref:Uncharacterized protein n=1 Tax=Sphingomonas sanxanigenens DSM 19645 = NX02 TaxID=1123269 RepID=W0AHG1_9SPHN|nr:hypothetical protein NX02_20510 [Sphingomonas sanxanigenens DSM 19645 = NX02]
MAARQAAASSFIPIVPRTNERMWSQAMRAAAIGFSTGVVEVRMALSRTSQGEGYSARASII